jgi:uncharacterized membrane protein
MNFKSHLETAWHRLWDRIVPLILMTLALVGICIITFGILGPVAFAGYFNAILLLIRYDREPMVMDIFSQMRLFWPLLAFGVVVLLLVIVGLLLFVLPGLVIALGLSYICLYMLPLMIDRELGIVEAVRESARLTLKGDVADHLVVMILFVGISTVGSSFFITSLVTQPFATLFLASVYDTEIRRRQPGDPDGPLVQK